MYAVHRLAAGSFDLLLNDKLIGGVVRNVGTTGDPQGWRAELLTELPTKKLPSPFTRPEHLFASLGEVLTWLGNPPVFDPDEAPSRPQQQGV